MWWWLWVLWANPSIPTWVEVELGCDNTTFIPCTPGKLKIVDAYKISLLRLMFSPGCKLITIIRLRKKVHIYSKKRNRISNVYICTTILIFFYKYGDIFQIYINELNSIPMLSFILYFNSLLDTSYLGLNSKLP